MSKARSATPCRRSAATPSPIRSPRPATVDLTAHVDFEALAHAAESHGRRAPTARSSRRNSCAASASRRARPRSRPRPRRETGGRDRRRAGAADRRRPHRDGRAVQGGRASRIRSSARCRASSAGRFRLRSCDHVASPVAAPSFPASATASSPARAACRRASTRASTAASAPTTRPTRCAENRARMAAALGVAPERFLTCYQIHSPDVVVAETPWTRERTPARRRAS